MESLVSTELDYKVKSVSHPTYQLSQVTQQSGAQSVALDLTGGQESIFELPPKVFNLSRSVLSFTITPAAVNAKYNWAHVNGITCIRQLQLYTRTGLFLCDLTDVNAYSNITMRYRSKRDQVLTWDKASTGSGFFEGLIPSNDTIGTITTTANKTLTAATTPFGVSADSQGAITFASTLSGVVKRPDNTDIKSFITEPKYVMPNDGTANTATPVINYQIPMGHLYDTIFNVNKDIYFGDAIYMRIVWAPTTATFYANDSATDPAGANPANVPTASISNLKFFLSLEQNSVINNELMSKVQSGMTLSIPYVYNNKVTITTSTNHNVSVRYNRAHGKKLKRLYWVPLAGTSTYQSRYDHDNLAGAKIEQYYTMVNNVRVQQFNYLTASGTDWIDKRYSLTGSCIGSSNEYYYNWAHIEDFSKCQKASYVDDDLSNEDDGLILETEVKYDVVAVRDTGPITLQHYVYAICTKDMTITPAGITLL